MPVGVSMERKLRMSTAPFEVGNKYHSQGLGSGGSALLDAVTKGKVHLAKFILDADDTCDVVNTRDFKGKTPLIRACYIKEEKTRGKMVDIIIEKGADVNIQDDTGRSALSYACELRCTNVLTKLVKSNAHPDIADNEGNTALIHAALAGNDTAVDILVRSFRRLGLQVDHVNNEGMTALLISAKLGHLECSYTLALEGRASITYRDTQRGLNAEEWAREQGCTTPEVLPFSVQGQAMLKARNSRILARYDLYHVNDGLARLDQLQYLYHNEFRELGGRNLLRNSENDVSKDTDEGDEAFPLELPGLDCKETRRRSLPTLSSLGTPEQSPGSPRVDKDSGASLPKIGARKKDPARSLGDSDSVETDSIFEEEISQLEKWVNKGQNTLKNDNDRNRLPEIDNVKVTDTKRSGSGLRPAIKGNIDASLKNSKSVGDSKYADNSSSASSSSTVTFQLDSRESTRIYDDNA